MSALCIGGITLPYTSEQEIEFLIKQSKIDYINLNLGMTAANKAIDGNPALTSMDRTLAVVGIMIDRGFLAVDLADEGQCIPWPNQDRASILNRIEGAWRQTNGEPPMSMIF